MWPNTDTKSGIKKNIQTVYLLFIVCMRLNEILAEFFMFLLMSRTYNIGGYKLYFNSYLILGVSYIWSDPVGQILFSICLDIFKSFELSHLILFYIYPQFTFS